VNYRFARYILGQIAIIEALFLAIPFFIGIGYKEDTLLAYGKLVSKLKFNARILYGIYIALTFIELMLLLIGKMSVFDSFIHAFGMAGTGGFSSKQLGVGSYNSAYIEIVISLFMILFSINFNVYYLILIGNVKKALRSES
jgi:trk system potassium uptake protein TrkH